MADSALAEAVKKAQYADALNSDNNDDEDTESSADAADDADTAAGAGDTWETGAGAEDTGREKKEPDSEETSEAPAAPATDVGYTFTPIGPPPAAAPKAPADVATAPRGTSQFFLNPATGSYEQKQYPDEEGGAYIIDQDTGQMVPRAKLATAADKAAQPPSDVVLPQIQVAGQAPDQLQQVERAQPAGTPAPDTLTQVERGQLVGAPAPDKLPQVERGTLVSVPPGTAPRAQPVDVGYSFTPQQPVAPRATVPGAPPVVQPAQPVTPTTQPTAKPAQPVTAPPLDTSKFANPDNTPLPPRVQAVGGDNPAAFIMHHTGGRGNVDSVVSTLQERHLGVEYVMDRDGNIYKTGDAGASNILPGWGPKGSGLNNRNIVGMEVIARDDADVTPAQKAAAARFIAARYPDTPIFGHGEVNPGHKEADEGASTKAAVIAYRARYGAGTAAAPEAETAAAPQAQPATKGDNGLYPHEKPGDFLTGKVSTFATHSDLASGQDNGVGAPRLGKLDTTSVTGIAVPEEALRAKYGNNYAAWRTARVDVVDQSTGRRLRVPIVDLGPRGDLSAIADMTPSLSNYFGGDKNLSVKIVDNAGPDVMKNPQLFADEQAALKNGFDSSVLAPGAVKVKPQVGYTFNSTGQTISQGQLEQNQRGVVAKLPEADSGNIIGLYKRLDQPVKGVDDSVRTSIQNGLKPEIISQMRAKFPDLKTDADAWAKATSDVNPLDVGQELMTKLLGYGQSYTNVMQKGVAASDQLHVNQFIDNVMPGASDADKHAYLAKLYGMPIDQRIAEIGSKLPQPQAGMPASDPQQIVSALDRLSDPDLQKQQAADLEKAHREMMHNVTSDPRLVGTGMEKIVNGTAQTAAFAAALANPVMAPAVMAQVGDQVREQFKQDHPEWDQKTLNDKAAYATIVQFFGQEAAMKIFGGAGGALTRQIESQAQRRIAQVLLGAGGASAAGTAAQVGTNVIAGDQWAKGVPEAAIGGAVLGGVAGGAHALGERPAGPEPRPVPSIAPLEAEGPPRVQPREVTAQSVLGPEAQEATPWYKQPSPIVTRAAERTAFSPEELQKAVDGLQQKGLSPEQLQQVISKLQPEPDWSRRTVHLAGEGEVPPPEATPEAQAKPMPFQSPDAVNGSEPWVSQIANRFTAERMVNNELGRVEPGPTTTPEAVIAKGLTMQPEEIAQHVSNLMNNKGGDPLEQQAAVRAEESRLAQVSRDASLFAEANPTNKQAQIDAQNAFNDVTDFHKGPVAKIKTMFHQLGIGLQGEVPVDLSTFNGLREAFLKDVGKPPPPEMEPQLRATAQRVRDASTAEQGAMRNLSAEIERQTARRVLPSADQVRDNIMQRMKVEPCPT